MEQGVDGASEPVRLWDVLGVPEGAAPDAIRSAYLRKVKACPPDRDPESFQRIREAYEILCDPVRRAKLLLFSGDPNAPFVDLLKGQEQERKFLGPGPWLKLLKEKKK